MSFWLRLATGYILLLKVKQKYTDLSFHALNYFWSLYMHTPAYKEFTTGALNILGGGEGIQRKDSLGR